jgi:hypothetical protein
MAESYLDQGLEGWVDAHSAPHMAIRDMDCADWQAFQYWLFRPPELWITMLNGHSLDKGQGKKLFRKDCI